MKSPDPRLSLKSWDSVIEVERQKAAMREMARRELAKRDILGFTALFTKNYQTGWIHREVAAYLDAFLEAVERRESPRLMVFLPPRHGKSQLVSRCFPPYILGRHPDWEVVMATYNQDTADLMGRPVRGLLTDPLYQELFPIPEIAADSNSVSYVKTTQGGSYTAVGIGGPLTARGANILIIDDPVKDREDADSETMRQRAWDWYSSTARTRLYEGGGIVVLQTRWHEGDISGMLLEKAKDNPDADQWHVYSFPAIATKDEKHRKKGEALCENMPPIPGLKSLNALRASMQARDWTALYQQNPVPDEGNFFKREWLKYYKIKDLPKSVYNYGSCDLAIGEDETNDYTVLGTVAVDSEDNLYLRPDLVRERINAHDITEHIVDNMELHKPMYTALERGHISKTIGPHLKKRMQERGVYSALWDAVPTKDKVARARSLQGRMQMGKVYLPDVPITHEVIVPELLAFPAGKHDDIVDMLAWICLMLESIMAAPPPKDLPPEPATPGSWHDLYGEREEAKSSKSHRPTSLFAHLKKKKS